MKHGTAVPLLALLAMLSGCVVVPYPVSADVAEVPDFSLDPNLRIGAGPRRLIADISERVSNQEDIDIVDSITFRDAAFPEGGWRLLDLLDPARSIRVAERLDVEYLVLLGPALMDQSSDEHGGYMPLVAGVMYAEEKSTMSAVIVDLRLAESVVLYRVEASGTPVALVWVVVAAMKDPMTESAVLSGLSEAIARRVVEGRRGRRVRIAILAAEGSDNPFGEPAGDTTAYNAEDDSSP